MQSMPCRWRSLGWSLGSCGLLLILAVSYEFVFSNLGDVTGGCSTELSVSKARSDPPYLHPTSAPEAVGQPHHDSSLARICGILDHPTRRNNPKMTLDQWKSDLASTRLERA